MPSTNPDMAHVEALEAENRRLREALEPFSALADIFDLPGGTRPQEGEIASWIDHRVGERTLTVEHLRTARAALKGAQS